MVWILTLLLIVWDTLPKVGVTILVIGIGICLHIHDQRSMDRESIQDD